MKPKKTTSITAITAVSTDIAMSGRQHRARIVHAERDQPRAAAATGSASG